MGTAEHQQSSGSRSEEARRRRQTGRRRLCGGAGGREDGSKFGLRQIPAVNGAIVAIDPFTGHIVALSGGSLTARANSTAPCRQCGSRVRPSSRSSTRPRSITATRRSPGSRCALRGRAGTVPAAVEAGELRGRRISRPDHAAARHGAVAQRHDRAPRSHDRHGSVAETAERMGVYDKLPRFLSMSLGAGDHAAEADHRLCRIRQRRAQARADAHQPRTGSPRQDRLPLRQRDCNECNQPNGAARKSRCWPRTGRKFSTRAPPIRSSPCCRASCSAAPAYDQRRRKTARRQDRNVLGLSRHLVHRLLAGSRRRRLCRLRRSAASVAAKPGLATPRRFSASSWEALADKPATPFRVPEGSCCLFRCNRARLCLRARRAQSSSLQARHRTGIGKPSDLDEPARAARATGDVPSAKPDTPITSRSDRHRRTILALNGQGAFESGTTSHCSGLYLNFAPLISGT